MHPVGEEKLKKLLVSGLNRSTSKETLKEYFSKWGEITHCDVILDCQKKSRGFGYVTFDKAEDTYEILKIEGEKRHVIDGEVVEVKREELKKPEKQKFSSNYEEEGTGKHTPEVKSKAIPESTCAETEEKKEEIIKQNPKPEKQSGAGEFGKIFKFAGVFITVVIAAIWIKSDASQHPGSNPNFDYIKIYENGLHKLQDDFKNQTDRFWKILRSRGLAHLKNTLPPQPLVLLIVAPPSTHSFVDCFTKRLAVKLDPQYPKQLNVINGKEYTRSSGHETKEMLDNKLKEALENGRRAAVISNLELLPPPSPLLFYSYCDNENAPFKHVAILFTVHLPREPSPLLSPVETEGLVENFLSKEVWADGSEYDLDAVAALLSRIADTVVVLSGEDEKNLESACDSF